MQKATFVALLAAGFLITSPARSEPTEAEKRTSAEAIFTEASQLMTQRNFARACPMLEEVVKLQPLGIGAKMVLGDCYIGQGKLASAHAMFRTAASMAAQANQPDRASSAQDRAQSLEPRLSRLTIAVPPETASLPGLTVTRDGESVLAATYNLTIAIDGGRYTVRASAPGKAPFEQVIEVPAEGGALRVNVALDGAGANPAPLPPASDGTARAAQADPPRGAEPAHDGMPAAQIAGIAVGGAGIVTGAIGLGVALSGVGRSNDATAARKVAIESGDTAGEASAQADYDSGAAQTTAGWVVTGIGGAALVTGVLLFVLAPDSKDHADTTAWRLEPHGARDGGGIALHRAW